MRKNVTKIFVSNKMLHYICTNKRNNIKQWTKVSKKERNTMLWR